MELLIKLYVEKPSRIAIKYMYEHLAVREYENLLAVQSEGYCHLKMELSKDRINVRLVNRNTGKISMYKNLEYNAAQLRNLQMRSGDVGHLIFVHVFPRSNALFVAKPFHQEKFIFIDEFEILNLQNR